MLDTDITPDAATAVILSELQARVGPLPSTVQRCWAWCRIGHDVAAAELGGTPVGEPSSSAVVFVYGGLLLAMSELEGCGFDDCRDADYSLNFEPMDLDRDQARRLLPHIMERVMWETEPPRTPALRKAMSSVLDLVADDYIALTGSLPDRILPDV